MRLFFWKSRARRPQPNEVSADLAFSAREELQKTYRHHEHVTREAARYIAISKDETLHPVKRRLAQVGHVLGFAARLFIPDFLVGHPNLIDNLRTLMRHKNFRPLRAALAAWLIFSVVVCSSGVYSLLASPQTHAAGTFSMKTGYYVGTGAALAITGVGFQPEVLIIKADTAAGSMVWKSSTMPSATTSYLGVATADNNDSEILITSDGFTLSAALEVNTINVRYTYVAFAGSDCTSGGVFCVGTYAGTGASNQVISTGFVPDLVWTKRTSAAAASFRTSSMAANNAGFFAATANDTTGVYFQTLDAGGSFTVGATNNGLAGVYNYVAFKNVVGSMIVGTFTGNGTDNRNITGVGFEPDFALVKQNSANAAVYNTTETWGDNSSVATATALTVNNIQSLDADGFQVGNSVNVNANTVVSNYFAMGGAPDPTTSGSFLMERGSYTGTGATLVIPTTFRPDLVMIKASGAQYGVWATSLEGNITHYFANSAVGFTGGVTTMDATSFTVGTSAVVNTLGNSFEYTVYGNATTPHRGAGAADFILGAHTGNGITARSIDHLGMTPSMITLTRTITTAALSMWKAASPVMADNTSAYFSATADVTDGSAFAAIGTDAFTLGTAATTNAAAGAYVWFAFKEGSAFDIGSYTGNGVGGTDITGLGFDPAFVWIKRTTAVQGVHRSTSSTLSGQYAQYYTNIADAVGEIIGFVSDGFEVGTAAEANANTGAYRYAAWKSTASANAPATPTNSAPASSATDQDLNPTLTGSAYSDPDSNAQTDTQWQVDDDSDFATPVWTRTAGAAESSTSVTSGNGTFANELSGDTALDHNTTYYWRVRYSDGVYSSWSTGTAFTTNAIATPTHSSPSNGGTVTSLTPTLTASAFSDPQSGHTGAYAQWQIDTSSAFTSPYYDSGAVAYSNTFAVPSAILSDKTTYYWRVRYEDSTNQWSSYSTATRFLVAQSVVAVTPLFSGSVVDQGDGVNIDAQVKLTDGTAINDATVTINVYNPAGTKVVDAASMSYLSGSSGVYRYAYTVPSTSGSYLYQVTATSGSVSGTGAANFEARTLSHDVSAISSAIAVNEAAAAAERAAQAAERAAQEASRAIVLSLQTDIAGLVTEIGTGNISAIKTKTDTISWGDVTGIVTATGAIKTKTDTIDWTNVTGIKTKTDTIAWGDVTGIATNVGTIQTGLSTLLTEIGTGNVAAIKTATDSIDWSDVTGLVTDTGAVKLKTDTIDWTHIAAIKTKTDTIAWSDVTGIASSVSTLQSNVTSLVSEIGTGRIAAIKTATDSIDWSDVTGLVTDTGAVKLKTDTIDWTRIAAIKTATDTIDWADVTGISTALSALQTDITALVGEIGTGSIAAIKTATDTIDWADITGLVTDTGAVKLKTDTIDWTHIAAIKTKTDTISWADITGIAANVTAAQAGIAGLVTEIGTGSIAAIKTATDTIDWADITGLVTDTGAVKAKTDTISWADVAAIKTKTDTIAWSDISGIKLKTDTIVWGDISTLTTNVATLITEIGTGNIAAIKTATDSIDWGDVTGIVTSVGSVKTKTDTIDWTDVAAIQTATDTIAWSDITGIKIKTDTIVWDDVTAIGTDVASLQDNLDILVGAMVVTRSTVADLAATTTSFVTALTNTTSNFYKNAVITFTSGLLNGQVRRISDYNGTTKVITVSPALSFAPANTDAFTIAKQNVYVEQQVAENEATQAAFRSSVTSRLASIEGKVDALTSMLDAIDTGLDSLQGVLSSVRASQVRAFDVSLSSVDEISAGQTYRAVLTVLDYQSEPADIATAPTITIYNAARETAVSAASMTEVSTGVYEYTYAVSADATAGLWEARASVDVGGAADVVRSDFWQVSGAPSQVIITSMEDLTAPEIAANVTITNEGGGAYEYDYEWCVVTSEGNTCGDDDDVYYGSAAKLIDVGQDFDTTLTATVPGAGSYWFKVVVHFGTDSSASSRSITVLAEDGSAPSEAAQSGTSSGNPVGTTDNDDTVSSDEATTADVYDALQQGRAELEANAEQLAGVLETMGMLSAQFQSVLSVGEENTESLKEVQNKLADLRAVASTTRTLIEQTSAQPIVQTYMKFNSVEIHFLITNPAESEQTVHFSALLPEEAKPEHILDSSGLSVDYNTTAGAYEVSGDVTLAGNETITKKVEMKDIWVFADDELAAVRTQVATLVPMLASTQYAAQAVLLQSDILVALDHILAMQKESYSSPQEHIVTYRENMVHMEKVQENLAMLKGLTVDAGASQGVVGKIGGIQTFATWGIIIALIVGFGLLSAVIFAMWRHQTVLAAMSLGMSQKQAQLLITGKGIRTQRPLRKTRSARKGTTLAMQGVSIRTTAERAARYKRKVMRIHVIFGLAMLIIAAGVACQVIREARRHKAADVAAENTVTTRTEAQSPSFEENTPVQVSVVTPVASTSEGGDAEAPVEPVAPSVPNELPRPYVVITETPTGWLNVRASPTLEGTVLTQVEPGEAFTLLSAMDGWYYIALSDTEEGWIIATYATVKE